jgi:hypothetical protein
MDATGWPVACPLVVEAVFAANPILRPGMKNLDAGCGTGPVTRTLYHLARRQEIENVAFCWRSRQRFER